MTLSIHVRRVAWLTTLGMAISLTGCAAAKVETNVDRAAAKPLRRPLIIVMRDSFKESTQTLPTKEAFVQQLLTELRGSCVQAQVLAISMPAFTFQKTLDSAIAAHQSTEIIRIAQQAQRGSQVGMGGKYSTDGIEIGLVETDLKMEREMWKALVYVPVRPAAQAKAAAAELRGRMVADGVLTSLCEGA